MAEKKFVLDPENIQGLDYYLEGLEEDLDVDYPKSPNHAQELTVKGFCAAANMSIEPFGEALKKAREINGTRG